MGIGTLHFKFWGLGDGAEKSVVLYFIEAKDRPMDCDNIHLTLA
jgi:hypothetical protein